MAGKVRLAHDATRARILEVAAEVFQRGYRSSSLDEVAARLRVTKPAIYHYFPSKEALLCELYERVVTLALSRVEAVYRADLPAPAKLEAMLRAHIGLIAEHVPLFTIFFQEKQSLPARYGRRVRPRKRAYSRMFEAVYREGVREGFFPDLDPVVATYALLGMGSWLYQWYRPRGRLTTEQIADIMVSLALPPRAVPSPAAGPAGPRRRGQAR